MSRLLLLSFLLFSPACATEADGDDESDGDADADVDGGADAGPGACQLADEPPTCDLDGMDAVPALLEPGCNILAHTFRMDYVVEDAGENLDPRIVERGLSFSISPEDPDTFPLSPDVTALINGCEIPRDPVVSYSWVMDEDAFNVVLTGGRHFVLEVREVGAVGTARLFYRQDLVMPAVLPNIQAPAQNAALPDPQSEECRRGCEVDITWDPFDVSQATWAPTSATEIRAWIVGGARPPVEDPNHVSNVNGTTGTARFNAGAFNDWDWVVMTTRISNNNDNLAIHIARRVN